MPVPAIVHRGAVAPLLFQRWNEQQFQPFVVQAAMLRTEFRIYAAQRANAHWGTGHQDPFDITPFADGSDPTAAPHALPALRNTDDIRALTAAQSSLYRTNYQIF
ncbi:hypothetical protein B0H17DRAFT_1203583 [Mycena rosella]|uniref:Mug135-like C-terminal domain-containing protein n=1 Tax=Mycena rosella TaxID=1033263 RepID=A0AAD7DCZ9_MYCRO|nr:hypothetical protein B0H17DRAFT_1203583 [Mycena rosella]